MEMYKIVEAINLIASDNSRLHKENALKNAKDIDGFCRVMEFIYNPYIRTGIAKKKLAAGQHNISADTPTTFDNIMDYLKVHCTGSGSDVFKVWEMINALNPELHELAKAIATKDLKIGVTATTLNKVYGKTFIPKVGVMLSNKFVDYKSKVKGPFIVTEKLDGIRRILVKNNGVITMYSRSGIQDEGLYEIEHVAKLLPDNMVYDGELLAKGDFKDCIAQRQATNSIANSKGQRKGVCFNIFDVIPYEDFIKDSCEYTALSRKVALASIFSDTESIAKLNIASTNVLSFDAAPELHNNDTIKAVPVLGVATTETEINSFAEPIWARRGEGVMLNTMAGKYRIKRSTDILKVKSCESYDLEIIDFIEGEGKFAGMLGALVVDYKGNRVGIGSGFNDYDRQYIWDNQATLKGKVVEIDCFGESTNVSGTVSLNCPIYRGIRLDKEVK